MALQEMNLCNVHSRCQREAQPTKLHHKMRISHFQNESLQLQQKHFIPANSKANSSPALVCIFFSKKKKKSDTYMIELMPMKSNFSKPNKS